MPRYLTKSRFKLASECATKLYYTGKRDRYADQSDENSFLMILAEGGFQVGELAKLYHPGGVDIPELDHEKALARTAKLLQQDEVVIFEAAFAYAKLFIRVDVLIKKDRQIELIAAFSVFKAATILTQEVSKLFLGTQKTNLGRLDTGRGVRGIWYDYGPIQRLSLE